MKIVSITHANDIDGIGSAALLKERYMIPSARIFFTDYSIEGISYVEKSLRKILDWETGTVLFLTDLGMNKKLIRTFIRIIREVKQKRGRVIWFDHHVWHENELRKVASICDLAVVGENPRYCATEITYRNLGFKNGFEKKFIDLVHYSDFNLTPRNPKMRKLIGIYALSITFYNTLPYAKRDKSLRHLVEVIAGGRFADSKITNDAEKFGRLNKRRIGKMLKRLHRIRNDVFMGFSDHIQSTQGCGAIMKKTGCDIAIYVNMDKFTIHLRSKKADTTVLSKKFGGGGHPHASAFRIEGKRFNYLKTEKDRVRFADLIREKIEELY